MPYPGTLTKAHIIDAVAERNGFTRKKSIETVEILLELIKQSLALSLISVPMAPKRFSHDHRRG